MAFQCMRQALLGLASAALLLLGGCGSGTIESQLAPSRVIAFGDAFTDAGQTSNSAVTNAKYTVNDGSNNWAQAVAAAYGRELKPAVSGGTAYATGNVRVVSANTTGDTATPTIQQQIDTFLATNPALDTNDLVLMNGGFSDIISEMSAYLAGPRTSDRSNQMLANLEQAGRDFAAQAKRLVAAGGKHVVVVGSYDLGKSPWAAQIGQQALLSSASSAFNDALLIALVDQGANMLYVDAALVFNQAFNSPASYGLSNVTVPACNSSDAGAGIGIGMNQVNSSRCTTPDTIAAGIDYTKSLFADAIYPTPLGHQRFAEYAFSKIRSRW